MEDLKININYLGVTYKSAEVKVRELFSLSDNQIEYAYNKFKLFNIDELFIISTCLRTEFYSKSNHEDLFQFVDYIYKKFSKNTNLNNLTHKKDNDCIEHLIKVTSGLESIVFGETQITNQIKNAFKISSRNSSTGPILSKMIQSSLEAGKRIKNETSISKGSLSFSHAAVIKLKKTYQNHKKLHVFVIGAGITGKVTVYQLLKNGFNNITIYNRNITRGQNLAQSFNVNFKSLDNLFSDINKADVIFTCTNSNKYLITCNDTEKIKPTKKLYFIDLSVPRNIDPKIDSLSNFNIITIDNLKNVINQNKISRKNELPIAYKIISEIKDEFITWIKQLKVVPTISGLKHFFEELQINELSKLKNKYDHNTIKAIDIFSRSLLKKILKEPIQQLKSENFDEQSKSEMIDVLQKIYPLSNSKHI